MSKVPLSHPQGRNSRGWNTVSGVYEPVGNKRNFPNNSIETLGRISDTFVYTPKSSLYRGRNRILKALSGTVDPTNLVPSFPGQTYLNTSTSQTWSADVFAFPPGLTASSWTGGGGGS